jgi:N-acetylneuraminic acid mutarotase
MAVGAAGGKILFAGGYSATDINGTSRVDIYDIARNTWSTAELSQPRYDITAVAAGNKILFAGGGHGTNLPGGNQNPVGKTVVDIYDASTNTWSVTVLSEARSYLCAATVGDKVFFAGGNNAHADATNKVDVYNTTTNTWSTATLSVPRAGISAVSVNNKVYFAGGFYYPPSPADTNFTVLNTIDIYDNSTNTWSTASLSEPQGEMAGVAIGGKILWAGGYAGIGGNPTYPGLTCKVQVTDAGAQSYSTSYLSCPTRVNAFPKDNKIIYFSSYLNTCDATRFDIYNPSTNTWSVGVLPIYREAASVIAVNDDVYLAGGFINNGYSNINNVSNQVYKVVF